MCFAKPNTTTANNNKKTHLHLPGDALQLRLLQPHALRDAQRRRRTVAVQRQRSGRHIRIAPDKVHLNGGMVGFQRQQTLPHHRIATQQHQQRIGGGRLWRRRRALLLLLLLAGWPRRHHQIGGDGGNGCSGWRRQERRGRQLFDGEAAGSGRLGGGLGDGEAATGDGEAAAWLRARRKDGGVWEAWEGYENGW